MFCYILPFKTVYVQMLEQHENTVQELMKLHEAEKK